MPPPRRPLTRFIIAAGISATIFFTTHPVTHVWADCGGCCSGHGGVCCIDGVSKCCDGSWLSSRCRWKRCDVCPPSSSVREMHKPKATGNGDARPPIIFKMEDP